MSAILLSLIINITSAVNLTLNHFIIFVLSLILLFFAIKIAHIISCDAEDQFDASNISIDNSAEYAIHCAAKSAFVDSVIDGSSSASVTIECTDNDVYKEGTIFYEEKSSCSVSAVTKVCDCE